MRSELAIIVAVVLTLSACGRKESDPVTADSAGTGTAPAPNAGFDYTCTDGATFNARIDRGNVLLTMNGSTLTLPPDTSASGAHYSAEGTTFIATGREATLIKAGEKTRTCETKQ